MCVCVRIVRDVEALGETSSPCATARPEMERRVPAGRVFVRPEFIADPRRERQCESLPGRVLLPGQLGRLQRAAVDRGTQRTATVDRDPVSKPRNLLIVG